ncbi:MAG: ATPase [Burkholderiaceae bacterium]|nr:ATPase [Burkholderiaceae bacterium]
MKTTNIPLNTTGAQPESRKLPPSPRAIEDTGLDLLFLVELLAKILFLHGRMSIAAISCHVKLPVSVLEAAFAFMRQERLCEMTSRGEGSASIFFQLSETGRNRAREYLQRSHYAGPAPVTLEAYCAQVENQMLRDVHYTRDSVARVFNGIVVQDAILDQLGAAMNSGRSIFIYGPAGSGKTFIAETLVNLLPDSICVPYAIVVDDEVIQIYDPLIHHVIEQAACAENLLERRDTADIRWQLCRRPVAISGGELTLNTLDLEFDKTTRYYQAPPHVKANNGIYIVDDLGHQSITPRELMNRWIVPLDRRRDYLTLHTGYKFRIPFDVKVIFSSNLTPESLADDAFLRRLGYKIYFGTMSEDQYCTIFRSVCEELSIPYSKAAFKHLLHERHYKEGKPLLACYPRDLLSQVRDLAQYENRQPTLTNEALDWAWQNYFATL